ncbi:MAG: CotH kinase family protein [Alistipes sp.]|nr:CotH kinase family protein [Alistipes sp.]
MVTTIFKRIAYLMLFVLCTITIGNGCTKEHSEEEKSKSVTELIKEAHQAGKIISSIKTQSEGWVITFTDNTTIEIKVGADYEKVVNSIVKDIEWGVAKITLTSGEVFIFKIILDYPSELARVYITTPGKVEITSKEEWLKGCNIRIIDTEGNEDLNVPTSIRGRGNSTWKYPKKPYAIKLDSKAEVLGMPKHKRWVLLANWLDRTLLRNDVALEMARQTMAWAPRGEFVEVFLNGKHQGNYYLCEQIKIDKNRVNVDELKEDSDFTNSSIISGGYLLEFDTYGPKDEINYFYTDYKKFPVTIKEPDEEVITSWTHPGYLYIQDYVNEVEMLLKDKAPWNQICEKIDITSFIDFWFIYELAVNREIKHPKSAYMYKKRDGKLYAGPAWDFDYATFRNLDIVPANGEHLWYGELLQYPEFKAAVKSRWREHKALFESIDGYILRQAELIRKSNEVNIEMWPIDKDINKDYNMSFDDAIAAMRSAYQDRLQKTDAYISGL